MKNRISEKEIKLWFFCREGGKTEILSEVKIQTINFFSCGLTTLFTLKVYIRDTCQYDSYTNYKTGYWHKALSEIPDSHKATNNPVSTTYLGQVWRKNSKKNTLNRTRSIWKRYNKFQMLSTENGFVFEKFHYAFPKERLYFCTF